MRDVVGRLGAAILAGVVIAAPAAARSQPGGIGTIDGSLAARLPDQQRWAPGRADEAIAAGQRLRTDPRSRAELRLASGTLDIAPGTRLDIVSADGPVAEFALPQGRIRLRLARLDPGRIVAVDLPQGGLWINRPGECDIDAGALPQPGRIAVLSGDARFTGHDADTDIKTDEAAVLTGINPVIIRFERAAAPDAFVAWGRERDASLPPAPSLSGTAEPPAAERAHIAPAASAAASRHAEARPVRLAKERVRRHRRYARRHLAHVRRFRHAYAAYRPFNPLQPLFNLFRW